jgi:hypothetical protein
MDVQRLIREIDSEIERLTKARRLLAGTAHGHQKNSRPKKSAGRGAQALVPQKSVLSAAGRAKIAAAQKRRWAAQKKLGK